MAVHVLPGCVMEFICGKILVYYFNTSSVNLQQLWNAFLSTDTLGEIKSNIRAGVWEEPGIILLNQKKK